MSKEFVVLIIKLYDYRMREIITWYRRCSNTRGGFVKFKDDSGRF